MSNEVEAKVYIKINELPITSLIPATARQMSLGPRPKCYPKVIGLHYTRQIFQQVGYWMTPTNAQRSTHKRSTHKHAKKHTHKYAKKQTYNTGPLTAETRKQ